MTEETEGQSFNPKPDTAEGVGAMLATTLKFVDDNGLKVRVDELTSPDGVKVPFVIDGDGIVAVPASAFDEYRKEPLYRGGTAKLLDLDSFIEHARRFLDKDSVVFADNNREHPSLTTVLDYHPAGADSAPRWGRHRDTFAFPLSDEWQAWNEFDGKGMEMPVFARFLEDHIVDVIPANLINLNEEQMRFVGLKGGMARIAEPAKLMEIATGLRIYEEVETVQAFRTESGESKMAFQNHQPGGQNGELTVPSLFAIGIPVFKNGEPYQVLVQLRYRAIGGGKVAFFYEMWRADRVFDHAFSEATEKVAQETGLPVLLGHPE